MTTLSVLGCGTLGTAILLGVLDAIATQQSLPAGVPTNFSACVTRAASVSRIMAALPPNAPVTAHVGNHLKAVSASSIVLLGCKPYMVAVVLSAPGMSTALGGKLLISICAGVSIAQLASLVPASTRIVRVMPNTAAGIRESMTVISPGPSIADEEKDLVAWIFGQIGKSLVLDEKHMDAATALCGSGPAFYALIIEAMADGGVLMGVPRKDATLMAAQSRSFP